MFSIFNCPKNAKKTKQAPVTEEEIIFAYKDAFLLQLQKLPAFIMAKPAITSASPVDTKEKEILQVRLKELEGR